MVYNYKKQEYILKEECIFMYLIIIGVVDVFKRIAVLPRRSG